MSKYDELIVVRKHDSEAKTFDEILKFNPYHDGLGRFSSANGATSFTFRTNSTAGQKAIANIKAKQHAEGGSSGGGSDESKPSKEQRERRGNQERQKDHPDGEYGLNGVTENGVREASILTEENAGKAREFCEAVKEFTGPYSSEIRQYQTDGPPPDYSRAAKNLEEFIEKSPKWEGEVHRGIGTDRQTAEEIIRRARAGEEIGMLGASSWTSDSDIAQEFASGNAEGAVVLFRSKGLQNGTSVRYLSQYPHEDEILMSNDARWKATKVDVEESEYGDLMVYIDCESTY